MGQTFDIFQARTAKDLKHVETLWRTYHRWLGYDACFQNFDNELANLPGAYGEPEGALLLARGQGRSEIFGVAGMRSVSPHAAEIKRLYVVPEVRGSGLGRLMTAACLERAKNYGYKRVCLETLTKLGPARSLYRSMGFQVVNKADDENQQIIAMEFVF